MTSRVAVAAMTLAAGALVSACAAGPTAGNGSGAPGLVTHLTYRYLTNLGNGAMGRDYGYNLVDLGPYRAAIDALPAGERALVWIGNYSKARCAFDMPDASVRQALTMLAGDPKVAGYYLADEADDALPAYGGHCPHVATQVTQRSRLVHQLAPGAFTYELVTEPGNFFAFAHATDVMGADPYPCLRGRACDWAKIPAYIAALDAAHVPRYWAVLQAFGYGKWRAPTAAEMARMIGQWAHSRWQGEQTFSWSYLSWSLKSHPDLLAVLKSLNAGNAAAATGTSSDADGTIPSGSTDPEARISVLVQVCTLNAADSCDPGNAAHWASSAIVYGTTVRWRVVITNTGTSPLTGIHVTSSLTPKQNDCAGPVQAGPLKAGAVVAYECESDHITAPATVIQTVTVSADPPAGPFITPASSAATARVASAPPPARGAISALLQVCILPNQASCDPTRAADWASSGPLHRRTAVWRVVITNTSTVALSHIYATDKLAGTSCGGFVTGSLAAGAVTQYECHTDNVTQTTTNTVTATGDLPSGAPVTSPASSSTAVVSGSSQPRLHGRHPCRPRQGRRRPATAWEPARTGTWSWRPSGPPPAEAPARTGLRGASPSYLGYLGCLGC